jgi:hypothetical protein
MERHWGRRRAYLIILTLFGETVGRIGFAGRRVGEAWPSLGVPVRNFTAAGKFWIVPARGPSHAHSQWVLGCAALNCTVYRRHSAVSQRGKPVR